MTKIINYFLFIIALHVVFVCHGAVLLVKDKNLIYAEDAMQLNGRVPSASQYGATNGVPVVVDFGRRVVIYNFLGTNNLETASNLRMSYFEPNCQMERTFHVSNENDGGVFTNKKYTIVKSNGDNLFSYTVTKDTRVKKDECAEVFMNPIVTNNILVSEIRKSILTGYGDGSNVNREKIWEEFCQKAKATESDKIAAEKMVPRVKEEKKIIDKNKDIEISVEF